MSQEEIIMKWTERQSQKQYTKIIKIQYKINSQYTVTVMLIKWEKMVGYSVRAVKEAGKLLKSSETENSPL